MSVLSVSSLSGPCLCVCVRIEVWEKIQVTLSVSVSGCPLSATVCVSVLSLSVSVGCAPVSSGCVLVSVFPAVSVGLDRSALGRARRRVRACGPRPPGRRGREAGREWSRGSAARDPPVPPVGGRGEPEPQRPARGPVPACVLAFLPACGCRGGGAAGLPRASRPAPSPRRLLCPSLSSSAAWPSPLTARGAGGHGVGRDRPQRRRRFGWTFRSEGRATRGNDPRRCSEGGRRRPLGAPRVPCGSQSRSSEPPLAPRGPCGCGAGGAGRAGGREDSRPTLS